MLMPANKAVRLFVLFVMLGFGGVAYYLFFQNLMIQSSYERSFLGVLHEASIQNRRVDTLLDGRLHLHNFDISVEQTMALEAVLGRLGQEAAKLEDAQLIAAHQQLMVDYRAKELLLERIKAVSAVGNNSFRYLYELYEQLQNTLGQSPHEAQLRVLVSRFMAEASLGSLLSLDIEGFEPQLAALSTRLQDPHSADLLALFNLHASTLIGATRTQSLLLQKRDEVALEGSLEALYTLAQAHFADRHRSWMIAGHLAFGVGILFFVAFVIAFVREERLKKRLYELNHSLRDRIKEAVESQRQQEQMLVQQSKLAAMGEMIGAIAHQWRQPLNALSITIQDLEDAWGYGEVNETYIQELVGRSVTQINHMSETINDFRNFFKQSKEQTTFELTQAILQTTRLIEEQCTNHGISIVLASIEASNGQRSEDRVYVRGYLNEFKQAILNILSNAKDAILSRREEMGTRLDGVITITIGLLPGKAVLGIEDNGGGISTEPIERVFEPYFSTKEEGQGTGIGLYMAKMIIERNMNGQLRVENGSLGARFVVQMQRGGEDEV